MVETSREKIREAKKGLIELLSPGARLDAAYADNDVYLTSFLQGLLSASMAKPEAAAVADAAGGAAQAREKMIAGLERVVRTA